MTHYKVMARNVIWESTTVEADNQEDAIEAAAAADEWTHEEFLDEHEIAPDGIEDVEEIEGN